MMSGSVGAVDDYVLFGQVTAPGDGFAVSQVQLQSEGNFRAPHLRHYRISVERNGAAGLHDAHPIDEEIYFGCVRCRAAASKGHHYSAPVGVGAIDRRRDQVGRGNGPGGLAGVIQVSRTSNLYDNHSRGSLAVPGQLSSQMNADLEQGFPEGARTGVISIYGLVADQTVGQTQ